MNLFRPVAEFPEIALLIFIAVFAPCTKLFWPVTPTLTLLVPLLIQIFLGYCHPMCFRPIFNCFFKLQFLPVLQLFIWDGEHTHVCFCSTCFFILSFHAAPYQPFKNRVDKIFTPPPFGSKHAFTITCNSQDIIY